MKWLKKNVDPVFGFPRVLRFSWSTATKLLETEAVTVKWRNEYPEDIAVKGWGDRNSNGVEMKAVAVRGFRLFNVYGL